MVSQEGERKRIAAELHDGLAQHQVIIKNLALVGTAEAASTIEFTAEIDGVPIRHQFSGKVAGTSIDGTADLSGARLQSRMDWAAKLNGRSAQSTDAVQTTRVVSAATH